MNMNAIRKFIKDKEGDPLYHAILSRIHAECALDGDKFDSLFPSTQHELDCYLEAMNSYQLEQTLIYGFALLINDYHAYIGRQAEEINAALKLMRQA